VHSLVQITHLIAGAYTVLWINSLGLNNVGQRTSSDWEVMPQLYGSIPRRWQHAFLIGDELVRSLSFANALPFSHLSMFGDAAFEVLAGRTLPAIEALYMDIRMRDGKSRNRVLIPVVDGSEHALEAARLVSKHVHVEDAEIHLLYVHTSEFGDGEVWREPNELARTDAEARMAGLPIFEEAERELHSPWTDGAPSHYLEAQSGGTDLQYASEIHADLIVMGSHGKSKVLPLMLGTVSRKVVMMPDVRS
jgi:nucleotide-binding universal stress UspA family protein